MFFPLVNFLGIAFVFYLVYKLHLISGQFPKALLSLSQLN
jgi:hypothetical protein